jgi:putative PIN family toxin of toxin-antitoxin system
VIVVLDTNVIIAALVANGLCREVFRRAVRMRAMVSSEPLLDELDTTLARKFELSTHVSTFLRELRSGIPLVAPGPLPKRVCRDKDDDVVLATAIAARADYIVSGDGDLLTLAEYDGIEIVTPRGLLERLEGS